MQNHSLWITVLAACLNCGSSLAAKLECPSPPAQVAREVTVDTRGKVAALARLGAVEAENQTRVMAKSLLSNVPNADKVLVVQALTSVFCQALSGDSISDMERVDRFQAFSERVMSYMNQMPAPASSEPAKSASAPKVATATPTQRPLPRTPSTSVEPAKSISRGASVKEVGTYVDKRSPQWAREKRPYKVSFAREVGDLSLIEEIGFDDNDRAITHSLSATATRTTGRSPKTLGPEPQAFCESASQKLVQELSKKLGAPTQPLVTASKPRSAPVDWSVFGDKNAPCNPISFSKCKTEARTTTSSAAFELGGVQVVFKAELAEIDHEQAKTLSSSLYTKSARTCTVSVEDPEFLYLKLLDKP